MAERAGRETECERSESRYAKGMEASVIIILL
jgi:hypothetical protein